MMIVHNKRAHPVVAVPQPTIRQPGEGKGRLIFLLVVLVLAGSAALAWRAYLFGVARGSVNLEAVTARSDALADRVGQLTKERDELQQRVANAERGAQMDSEAAEEVRQTLVELQDERLELKEEIALLTSLVSNEKTKSGLRARRLVLEPLAEKGAYRFRFALSKSPQDDEEVEVALGLGVKGTSDGKSKTLSLSDIGEDVKSEIKFKQLVQIEGTLTLPEDFEPEGFEIIAKPKAEGVLGVEREFPWKSKP